MTLPRSKRTDPDRTDPDRTDPDRTDPDRTHVPSSGRSRGKTSTTHTCDTCGYSSARWFGRCPDCGAWSSAVEDLPGPAARAAVVTLEQTVLEVPRLPVGIAEVDRVLGGGLVSGSVVLLAGEPGIGKSTLVLQILDALRRGGEPVLLATGEESITQVSLRAGRISPSAPKIFAVATTSVTAVVAAMKEAQAGVVVVDSIQTLEDPELDQAAGSPTQVRQATSILAREAKSSGTTVVLVGHVTKDGSVAGPKTLEHMVDVVLSLEGDRSGALRLLRSFKNRFGACDETGVFVMQEDGLTPVPDPSAMLLADRSPGVPGSVVLPVLEGNRALLVEVQALTVKTNAPQARRFFTGFDPGRMNLVAGVVGSRLSIDLSGDEIYLAAAGGVEAREPAADLAVAAALISEHLQVPIAGDLVVLGELGLGGEVRNVPGLERRLHEAQRLGFRTAVAPRSVQVSDMHVQQVNHVSQVLDLIRANLPSSEAGQAGGVVSLGNRRT